MFDFIKNAFHKSTAPSHEISTLDYRPPLNDVFGQAGRSMVEMLGVLAIIGVLSVGAITGYSKAMRIYNSNWQKQQLEQLFINIIKFKEIIGDKADETHFEDLLEAFNEIPYGLSKHGASLKDKYNNRYLLHGGTTTWKDTKNVTHMAYNDTYIDIIFSKNLSSLSLSAQDLCYNILTVAKENYQQISRVRLTRKDDNETRIYTSALKIITPSEIMQECKKCGNQTSCESVIYFK